MRNLLGPLVLLGLLACAPVSARARCGDQPGDRDAADSAVGAIVNDCCCGPRVILPPRRTGDLSCSRRVLASLVATGALPHRCARTALRVARRTCHASDRPACPSSTTTTTTLPQTACRTASDCDDDNPCSVDACVRGRCQHECRCYGPGGGLSCCPGPAATCDRLRFFHTCGYPVCRVDDGPIPGIPPCTTEGVGEQCTKPGHECDPGIGCGVRLRCADHDPSAGPCPISQRSAKRDVAYLTPADSDRLRDELVRLPLATYRYRSEDPAARSRLGFVIDDAGQSPAVAPGGTMVDVYGYTTMAVAAIQAQEREIARLGRELEALRRECRSPRRR